MLLGRGMKIGKLKLANPFILAPMVDVTDCAYRKLCRESGASLAYTEMIYIDAILHENRKTKLLMKKYPNEKPVGLQITGNGIEEFKEFVKSGKWKEFDLIDLNCGCPSLRITGNEAGSYLLKNPSKICEMVKILKKTGKPVSVKIRLGFKKNNVMEVAREVERAGADALTVHGRLAVDGRNVPANWKWIKKVKEALKIPVIGNGDVFSLDDAKRMMQESGCDGVMIARGAIGNPGIFQIVDGGINAIPTALNGNVKNQSLLRRSSVAKSGDSGVKDGSDVKERLGMLMKYLKYQKEFFGKDVDIGRVKYVGGKFLKGMEGAALRREQFSKCKSIVEMEKLVREIK